MGIMETWAGLLEGPNFHMPQSLNIATVAVTAVSKAVWTLDHITILKEKLFTQTQLRTDGAKICRLTHLIHFTPTYYITPIIIMNFVLFPINCICM